MTDKEDYPPAKVMKAKNFERREEFTNIRKNYEFEAPKEKGRRKKED